jgi:hypothetical protein
MRTVSAQSAKMLTGYSNSLRDFAAGQTALNAETEARIQRFDGMRLERESEISARVDSWRYLDDEAALGRLEVVASNDADDLIAAASPQLPPPGLPALKFDTAAVGAVVKKLVELQQPLTLEQRVAQFVAYGTAVRDALKEDLDEAAADTATAENVAATGEDSVQATAAKPK